MIAYSGYVTSELLETALHAGLERFLELPFPLHAMKDAVCNSLRKHGHENLADYAAHGYRVTEVTHPKV